MFLMRFRESCDKINVLSGIKRVLNVRGGLHYYEGN